jgi:L-ascorbate metabolism protein UlaG (beta-lactamase superfamily)
MAVVRKITLSGATTSDQFVAGSVQFIGTATTLIRFAGFTILTDPNFLHAGDHAHLGYGLTSKRLTNPALEIAQLPPLDLCVLSHLHGDHWDKVAQDRLPKELPVITTPEACRELLKQGFHSSVGLRTWEAVEVVRMGAMLRATSLPGRHGPSLVNFLMPEVMGTMLEWQANNGSTLYRMLISGDTLVYDQLAEIPRRYPDINLALVDLGGTRLFGVLLTMDAVQGIKFIQIVRPKSVIPIHYDDYPVFKSSLEEFREAVRRANLQAPIHYLNRGDTFNFAIESSRAESTLNSPA